MKIYFTVIFVLVASYMKAQDADQEIKSKIKQVTVFLEGAQVTRQAQLNLKPGVSLLKLADVAPSIQEQSIQVDGTAGIKILSVSFRVNYLNEKERPERIALLENERRKILAFIKEAQSQEEVYKEEESILKTNKSIGGTSKGVEVEELKAAMDYFRLRLSDIKQRLLQIDGSIRKYNEELGKIESQLRELSDTKDQPTGEISIKVSSKAFVQSAITVKYLVKEAKWFPSYDVRAKDIQSPISVAYKANVTQHSGEDWENVELTISSGNPSEGGAKPSIKPWYLGFNNSIVLRGVSTINSVPGIYGASNGSMVRGRVTGAEDGLGLPGVNVLIKGTTVGTVTDGEGFYSLPLTADAQTLIFSFVGLKTEELKLDGRPVIDATMMTDVTQLSEVVVVGYGTQQRSSLTGSVSTVYNDEGNYSYTPRIKKTIVATPVLRQTNFEFTIDEPFSIKSDGEVRATEMVEYELDALYEYYCVPKLDKDVFLVAKVLHWDEYNFLEGEASLFFEGKYIGKSVMDTRNTTDTLVLSLGRDANVLVKREKVKELSSQHSIGSNQKSTLAYEISIRNKKAQPLSIVLEDQIPIPNTKDILVDRQEDSKAEYNEETGILRWKKSVLAGKSESIKFRYSVRFPKTAKIILE